MTSPVPPSLDRFGDELHRAVGRELRADPHHATAASPRLRRPRILAGGALGVAGVSAAAVLAFGGASAAPALAVTREANGTVLVTVNLSETSTPWVDGANDKLAAMGIDEKILLDASPVGASQATSTDTVKCAPASGPGAPTGPSITVHVTGTVPAGNTGAGATGIAGCGYMSTDTSASGNS